MTGPVHGVPCASLAPLATALVREVQRTDGSFKLAHLAKWARPLIDELVRLDFVGKNDPCYVEYQGAWEFSCVHVHVTSDTDPSVECWIVVARDGRVSVL